ncbi:hypothetical protein FMUAM8_47400 [Nocardia cyriacigeorgica]|nr:hypothetical protein FMUAM8_47400 [Nocardia cyriacigeorgica]
MRLPAVGRLDVAAQVQFHLHRERLEQFAVGQEGLHRTNLAVVWITWGSVGVSRAARVPMRPRTRIGRARRMAPVRPARADDYFSVTVVWPFIQVMVPPVNSLFLLPSGRVSSSVTG